MGFSKLLALGWIHKSGNIGESESNFPGLGMPISTILCIIFPNVAASIPPGRYDDFISLNSEIIGLELIPPLVSIQWRLEHWLNIESRLGWIFTTDNKSSRGSIFSVDKFENFLAILSLRKIFY